MSWQRCRWERCGLPSSFASSHPLFAPGEVTSPQLWHMWSVSVTGQKGNRSNHPPQYGGTSCLPVSRTRGFGIREAVGVPFAHISKILLLCYFFFLLLFRVFLLSLSLSQQNHEGIKAEEGECDAGRRSWELIVPSKRVNLYSWELNLYQV